MSWEERRAEVRIQDLMNNAPTILTERFVESYLPQFRIEQEQALQKGLPKSRPLVNLPQSKAVIVDAVHMP